MASKYLAEGQLKEARCSQGMSYTPTIGRIPLGRIILTLHATGPPIDDHDHKDFNRGTAVGAGIV